MTATPDPSEVFVQHQPDRRRWLVVGAVLGAVLLVLTVLYSVRWTVFSPSSVVNSYFDALADRDADGALRMTVAGADHPDRELLAAAVAGEAYQPPQQWEIADAVEIAAEQRNVMVEFSVGEERHFATLALRREDGFGDTVFHRWRITDGVRTIPLGEVPGRVAVNGAVAPAHDLEGPRSVPALLGGHEVAVPPDDPLWESQPVPVTVGPEPAEPVDVPLRPRPELQEEVERQLDEILTRCADSTELLPPGCPFGNARFAEASDVSWELTQEPTVDLMPGPDGFGDVTVLVQSATDGEAVVRGTEMVFGTEREFEIEVPFPVSGVVSVQGDSVLFEPSW